MPTHETNDGEFYGSLIDAIVYSPDLSYDMLSGLFETGKEVSDRLFNEENPESALSLLRSLMEAPESIISLCATKFIASNTNNEPSDSRWAELSQQLTESSMVLLLISIFSDNDPKAATETFRKVLSMLVYLWIQSQHTIHDVAVPTAFGMAASELTQMARATVSGGRQVIDEKTEEEARKDIGNQIQFALQQADLTFNGNEPETVADLFGDMDALNDMIESLNNEEN